MRPALQRVAPILVTLVLLGCGGTTEGGISGGGKIIGRTVTVYSLATDPASTNKDFVDGEKLALSDAGGRAGDLSVNFSSLDLGADDSDAAEAARRAINDPQIIAAIVDATPVTVPLFNAAGVLQVAPSGDVTPPPELMPSGRATLAGLQGDVPADFDVALRERVRTRAGARRRRRLPRDGRRAERDRAPRARPATTAPA